MAFLEDIGRTNTLSSEVSKLNQTAIALRSDLGNRALQQEQLGMERKKFESEQAISEVNLRTMQNKLAEYDKEQAILNNPIRLKDALSGMTPSVRARAEKDMLSRGLAYEKGGEYWTDERSKRAGGKILENDRAMGNQYAQMTIADLSFEIDSLQEQMNNPKIKPEQAQQAQAQIDALKERQSGIVHGLVLQDQEYAKQSTLKGETVKDEFLYQDKAGKFRWGLFDESGSLQKDLRAATADEIETGKSKGKSGDFAPDHKLFRNPSTGEERYINTRNTAEVERLTNIGFAPIGPEKQGFLAETGKSGAEYVKEVVSSSSKARSNIATLDVMDQLLDRFASGKLAGIQKSAQQWAHALGMDVNMQDLSSKEAFTAIGEQLTLQSRNLGEGMVLAGQMSDKDVQFLRDMNPQLLISKSGNKLIIKIRKAVAKRQIEIEGLALQYRNEHGGVLDELGFNQFVKDSLSKTSMFGIPDDAVLAGTDKATGLPVYQKDGDLFIPEF